VVPDPHGRRRDYPCGPRLTFKLWVSSAASRVSAALLSFPHLVMRLTTIRIEWMLRAAVARGGVPRLAAPQPGTDQSGELEWRARIWERQARGPVFAPMLDREAAVNLLTEPTLDPTPRAWGSRRAGRIERTGVDPMVQAQAAHILLDRPT